MKPTLIFVHGAWHSGKCFYKVIKQLEALPEPYTCVTVELPSTGSEENSVSRRTHQPDIDAVRAAVDSEIDKGNKILVISHSYGSLPGYEALKGIEAGKVESLILCGFMVEEGQRLGGSDHYPPLWDVQGDIIYPNDPVYYFYPDAQPEEQAELVSQLRHQTFVSQTASVTYAGWKHFPLTYVGARNDTAVPLAWQERMIAEAKQNGVDPKVIFVDSGHSPFITIPDEIVKIIIDAAKPLEG